MTIDFRSDRPPPTATSIDHRHRKKARRSRHRLPPHLPSTATIESRRDIRCERFLEVSKGSYPG